MVMDANDGPRDDRGQLILIGAITLAFILLGVVVVFNGVQYTQTISSGSATQDTSDVEVVEKELERGIEGIIEHQDLTAIVDSDLRDEIEDFVEYYARTKASQQPVNIDVDVTTVSISGSEATVYLDYSYDSRDVTREGTIELVDVEGAP